MGLLKCDLQNGMARLVEEARQRANEGVSLASNSRIEESGRKLPAVCKRPVQRRVRFMLDGTVRELSGT